jgi:L-ascorbate metabolism protein UlaG (beta-lactamase superfamily)
MHLTYQGTNSLVISKDQSAVIIDPHYTRPGLLSLMTRIQPNRKRISRWLNAADIDQLDAVLLTHTHYDHALDAPEVIWQKGGILFGSRSAVNLAKGTGLSTNQFQVVAMGRSYFVGNFLVRFHSARHIGFPPPLNWVMLQKRDISAPLTPPAWFWTYQSGEVYAIQVDNMLIFGSAGFSPGAYDGLEIETVVLSIAGLETQPDAYLEKYYHETVLAVGAQRVLLSHWDNFFRPLSSKIRTLGFSKYNMRRLKNLGERHGQNVHLLSVDEPVFL